MFNRKLFSLNGLKEYMRQLLVLGEYRGGNLIGTDSLGNRYYEIIDEKLMFPFRNRYVEYAAGRGKDASQVPAEWHGWLHSIVDDPPTTSNYKKSVVNYDHCENATGTENRYAPYNTTNPKIVEYNLKESGFKSLGDKIKNGLLNKN